MKKFENVCNQIIEKKYLEIDLKNFEEDFLNQLSKTEKAIFIGYYYENKSLKNIAFENNVSYAHARNLSVQMKRSLTLSLNFINEVNKKY